MATDNSELQYSIKTDKETYQPLKRLIRLKDASKYLGMGRHTFNQHVREYLTVISVGKSGIAFDRLELDAWLEQYKSVCGRPPTKRLDIWDAKERQVSTNVGVFGTLTNKSLEKDFVKALELSYSKKRKNT